MATKREQITSLGTVRIPKDVSVSYLKPSMVINLSDGPRITVRNPPDNPDGVAEFGVKDAIDLAKSAINFIGGLLGGDSGGGGGSGDVDVGDVDVEVDGDNNKVTIIIQT